MTGTCEAIRLAIKINNKCSIKSNKMRYQIKIEDVKKDDILYKTSSSKKLFMKGDYCKSNNKYFAEDYDDISSGAYFKKGKIVFVDYDEIYEEKGLISIYYVVSHGSDCDGMRSSRIYNFATKNEAEIFQEEQSIASDGLRFTTCNTLSGAIKYLD